MAIKFTLEKCKTKAAFSAKLLQKGKINLEKVKQQFTVILETPILLVISVNGIEVIVHRYGELLFKSGEDTVLMNDIAQKIYLAGLEQ